MKKSHALRCAQTRIMKNKKWPIFRRFWVNETRLTETIFDENCYLHQTAGIFFLCVMCMCVFFFFCPFCDNQRAPQKRFSTGRGILTYTKHVFFFVQGFDGAKKERGTTVGRRTIRRKKVSVSVFFFSGGGAKQHFRGRKPFSE